MATTAIGLSLLLGTGFAASSDDRGKADVSALADLKATPDIVFSSPIEAYRQGKAAFDEGWYGLALPALRYAAGQGVFGARLKLAKMYELGLGVPRNEAAAFDLYQRLTENNWELSNFHPAAPYIGQSLAALGVYYLNGIKEIGLKPDVDRAVAHFSRAAEYFGDSRAQYELAKLYLSGEGGTRDAKRAVSWLYNAARKDHAPAQALLGQLLWEGSIVPKRQMKALVLLTLAQENAAPQDSEWINGLYNTISAGSQPQEISRAKAVVARWVRVYQPGLDTRRIIVQKEVRIGIAEDRDAAPAVREGKNVSAAAAAEAETVPERDRRMWSGGGSFREIEQTIDQTQELDQPR